MNSKFELIPSEWVDDRGNLPCESDFDPFGGDLDAQSAWREFGGLSRTEVFSKFAENPSNYSEDFMFMGVVAFSYYYPAIERFLCDESISSEFCHRGAWILGESILYQFEYKKVSDLNGIFKRVGLLAEIVLGNISRYAFDDDDRERINDVWNRLAATMTALNTTLSHN